MGKRSSNGDSKKSKSKKNRAPKGKAYSSQQQAQKSEKVAGQYYYETNLKENLEEDATEIKAEVDASKAATDKNTETDSADVDDNNIDINSDINDYCEEIKANQQKILNRLKDLSVSLTEITLIRDSVNSLRVDNLTELYFTRQVRPLLDALNIISFATSNMSNAAIDFQANAFSDKKEIKNALNLSYKMNDEVDDIITALDRRLKIFLNEINKMDKNCPPFYFNKDS